MKYRILLAALCLGILVGLTFFSHPKVTPTGTASFNCYAENEPCSCDNEQCVCGEHTVPVEYCKQSAG